MVFSDGGTENPAKILNVYTNESRSMTTNARIFTYAVGKCLNTENRQFKNKNTNILFENLNLEMKCKVDFDPSKIHFTRNQSEELGVRVRIA